ncbi:hypothetical protein C8Q72DRAFT_885764 [Fomitopsis betulina]|nr:hypothetical protein C8Q72DRAFT_885764 [Fomitopsis betulina]
MPRLQRFVRLHPPAQPASGPTLGPTPPSKRFVSAISPAPSLALSCSRSAAAKAAPSSAEVTPITVSAPVPATTSTLPPLDRVPTKPIIFIPGRALQVAYDTVAHNPASIDSTLLIPSTPASVASTLPIVDPR